jgi:hypothetical protein
MEDVDTSREASSKEYAGKVGCDADIKGSSY